MPHGYVGINGTARKIVGAYIGVNGVAKKVKVAYVGVNGIAKKIYPRLPDAYQQVEYIRLTGGAEIDTGLHNDDLDEIYASIKKDWLSYGALFGNFIDETTECIRWIYSNTQSSNSCITTFASQPSGGNVVLSNCVDYDSFNKVHMTIDSDLLQSSTVNNVSNTKAHKSGNSNNTTIVLGKSRHSTVATTLIADIEYFIAKKNGKEVLNLVPCYRKSDNVAGMYDVANDVFYTNPVDCQGTIVAGKRIPRLPSEYQEVEYLEANGNQYINTGIAPDKFNGNYAIETKEYHGALAANGYVIGTSAGTGINASRGSLRIDTGGNTARFFVNSVIDGGAISIYTAAPKEEYNTIYLLSDQDNNYRILRVNGSEVTSHNAYYSRSNSDWRLFALASGSSKFVGRICYAKIWGNGQLVGYFVPCYRKVDNVAGMYDLVNNTFHTNGGSGSFIVGSDV